MARRKKSLWSRIGADAIVTLLIAVGAVAASQIMFQTQTRDFEANHRRAVGVLEKRLADLEGKMQQRIVAEARTETRLYYIERGGR